MFNDEDKHDIVALTSDFGSHGIKSQYTLEGEGDGEEGEEEMVWPAAANDLAIEANRHGGRCPRRATIHVPCSSRCRAARAPPR